MQFFRFLRRNNWDRERQRELQAHLEIETEEFIARGMSPEEAGYAARRKLGNVTRIREEIYQMNSLGFLETLGQDLRYAARLLRMNPGFTLVAVLSLALGIGANTAIFQLLDAVRLRSLPVANPQQLYEIHVVSPNGRSGAFPNRYPRMTKPIWEEIRARQQAFSSVFAWGDWRFNLGQGGLVRRAEGIWISGDYFLTLQVKPLVGRLISAEDDRTGCAPVATISYGFWQHEFGGAASAVGSTILLNTHPVEVIGVTPASFTGIDVGHRFDVAVPLCAATTLVGNEEPLGQRWAWWLTAIGRLKPGWSAERANAEMQAMAKPVFEAALPGGYFDAARTKEFLSNGLNLKSAAAGISDVRETYQDPLWILIAIAGVVLVIACANLANLLLARAMAREKEVAVRLAVGASRARLVRQFLAESLVLSVLGAGCGVALASLLARSLVAFLTTSQQPVFLDLRLNFTVLSFAAGLTIATCVLFGLAPALRATRIVPAAAMRTGGRGMTAGRERFTLQRVLVATQVALSLALLFFALLFARTFQKLYTLDVGFRANDVLVVGLNPRHAVSSPSAALDRQLFESIRSAPGIAEAARAEDFPMAGDWSNGDVSVASTPNNDGKVKISFFARVSPGFFGLMQIPLEAGRDFTEADTASSAKVAIVNQAFVKKIFGGGDALGRRFTKEHDLNQIGSTFEVVGITRDTRITGLRDEVRPMAYMPDTQLNGPGLAETVVVRSNAPLRDVLASVEHAVVGVNPGVSVEFAVLKTQIEETLLPEKLMATLSGFFGFLAGVLAVIGLYGVISYMVAQRRNEIGIRMALGADRGGILSMVLRGAGTLIVIGLASGALLALLGARAAKSLLYGLPPYDPVTLVLSVLLLASISLLAAAVPARRAAQLDPMTALRDE